MTGNNRGVGEGSTPGPDRRRKAWLTIQRALLVLGIALLGSYAGARLHGALLSRAAILNFGSSQRASPPKEAGNTVASVSGVNFSLWSEKRIDAYKQSLAQHFDSPLGVLRVPKLQLEVPVFNGTDDLTLNRGVGRIVGSARVGENGNVGIAGHRDGFFRGLKDVGIGDTMNLETTNGTETYVVDKIQVVNPDDVSVLRPTPEASLTLVTCYPFYFIGSAPQRYIVHASIVHAEQLDLKRN